TEIITITASVANWSGWGASILVEDNESTNLTLSLPPQVTEGQGVLTNAGRVILPGVAEGVVSVNIQSDNSLVRPAVSALFFIPGQRTGTFNIIVTNNTLVNVFDSVRFF